MASLSSASAAPRSSPSHAASRGLQVLLDAVSCKLFSHPLQAGPGSICNALSLIALQCASVSSTARCKRSHPISHPRGQCPSRKLKPRNSAPRPTISALLSARIKRPKVLRQKPLSMTGGACSAALASLAMSSAPGSLPRALASDSPKRRESGRLTRWWLKRWQQNVSPSPEGKQNCD